MHPIESFATELRTPLTRGCAKYARAVHSITDSPAVVYHARCVPRLCRRARRVHSSLEEINLTTKLPTLSVENRDIFWQYVTELSQLSLDYVKEPYPQVPTVDAIAANIHTRRPRCERGRHRDDVRGWILLQWRQRVGIRHNDPSQRVSSKESTICGIACVNLATCP